MEEIGWSVDGDELEILGTMRGGEGLLSTEAAADLLGLSPDDEQMQGLTLVVEESGKDIQGDDHTYGGRKISGGGYQCTTGFTVQHANGVTGVATAAHCTG